MCVHFFMIFLLELGMFCKYCLPRRRWITSLYCKRFFDSVHKRSYSIVFLLLLKPGYQMWLNSERKHASLLARDSCSSSLPV